MSLLRSTNNQRLKKRRALSRAAVQQTERLAESYFHYAMGAAPVAKLEKWFAQDVRHRALFNQAMRGYERAAGVLPCLPRRLPVGTLRALAPRRMPVTEKELSEAAATGVHDVQLVKAMHSHWPEGRERPALLAQWLAVPEYLQAFREFQALCLGLQYAQVEFLCAGVPVEPLPSVYTANAAQFRMRALSYRQSMRRLRQLQWREQRPTVLRLNNPSEKFQCYELEDGSKFELSGYTALEVRFSASRRTLKVLHGEAYCALHQYWEWPWHVSMGPMKLQMQAAECWLGYLSPQRVHLDGMALGLAVSAAGQPAQRVSGAVSAPAGTCRARMVYDGKEVRFTTLEGSNGRTLRSETGTVSFENESLIEVVHLLNRHNPSTQLKVDPAAEQLPVTGHFSLYQPQRLVRFLTANYGGMPRLVVPAQ